LQVVPVLLFLSLGLPLALSPILILTIDLFTEMPPAVSVAYEPSESDVMSRPPRNAATDRLLTWQVILYALTQAGVIETLNGLLAYFLVFRHYGIRASSLLFSEYFIGNSGEDMPSFPGCQSEVGDGPYDEGTVCFDLASQEIVLRQAQTAYFACVTLAQLFHIWLLKSRNSSVLVHGLFRNRFTIWAVLISVCLVCLIIFPESSHSLLGSKIFPARFWPIVLIAPILIAIWQEGRKAYVRRHPGSFVARYVHW
jgi:sodium/potassium-transporting ATPase subunit alpha